MSESEGVHHDGDIPADPDEERRPLDERPEGSADDRDEGDQPPA
jgi:hypothetical protein